MNDEGNLVANTIIKHQDVIKQRVKTGVDEARINIVYNIFNHFGGNPFVLDDIKLAKMEQQEQSK